MKNPINRVNSILDCVLYQTDKFFRVLLGVSFLPERTRRWLFDTGTSIFEIVHAVLIISWGVLLLAQDRPSALLPTYIGFTKIFGPQYQNIFGLIGIGIGLFTILVKVSPQSYSRRGRILVGFLIFLSALMWTMVGGAFLYNYPPISIGMLVYTIGAVFCYFTGEHIMYEVHQQDLIRGNRNNDAVSRF